MYDRNMPQAYESLAEHYAEASGGNYGHVFKSAEKLAKMLSIKCRLGVTIRNAYKENNHDILKESLNRLCDLVTALKEFASAYAEMWLHDGMPYGLEVCQTFIGGQILRAEYVRSVINAYLEKGQPIRELEWETVLPDLPACSTADSCWNSDWRQLISNFGF